MSDNGAMSPHVDPDLPDIRAYPIELERCTPRHIRRRPCRKCTKVTNIAYVDARGRGWPICLGCAKAAEPCACGLIGRGETFWDAVQERFRIRHQDGTVCTPINACERYRVPCSTCGRELAFTVIAARWNEKGAESLSCRGCDAKWRLHGIAYPPVRVSLLTGAA